MDERNNDNGNNRENGGSTAGGTTTTGSGGDSTTTKPVRDANGRFIPGNRVAANSSNQGGQSATIDNGATGRRKRGRPRGNGDNSATGNRPTTATSSSTGNNQPSLFAESKTSGSHSGSSGNIPNPVFYAPEKIGTSDLDGDIKLRKIPWDKRLAEQAVDSFKLLETRNPIWKLSKTETQRVYTDTINLITALPVKWQTLLKMVSDNWLSPIIFLTTMAVIILPRINAINGANGNGQSNNNGNGQQRQFIQHPNSGGDKAGGVKMGGVSNVYQTGNAGSQLDQRGYGIPRPDFTLSAQQSTNTHNGLPVNTIPEPVFADLFE